MKEVRTILTITFLLISCIVYGQTTTTESKSCGACKKSVSIYSKIGDICPHCGVRWGDENTSITSDYKSNKSYPTYSNTNQTKAKTKKKSNPFANKSKEYTINWLNAKLEAHKHNYLKCNKILGSETCDIYKNYDFKFENGYLIVKYNVDDEDIVNYIPLYDIQFANGDDYHFAIITKSSTVKHVFKTSGRSFYSSYVTIGFISGVTGMIDEISQAFKRIASLSSKPTSNILPIYLTEIDKNRPTLEATKVWILSKLNKYGNSNLTYEIIGWNLIIKSKVENSTYRQIIPLCSTRIHNMNNLKKFEFRSGYNKILSQGFYQEKPVYKSKLEFEFESGSEKNLINRMNNAFKNITYYCPKVTETKETF